MARHGGYDRDWHPGRAPGWRTSERNARGPRGYGRDYGGRGYDVGYAPYDQDLGASTGMGYGVYGPGWSPYAMVPGAWDPTLGWAGWPQPAPYAAWRQGAGGGRDEPRRVPPRESPAYGRGGDRELRRWAERHGYDVGYEIRPRRRR